MTRHQLRLSLIALLALLVFAGPAAAQTTWTGAFDNDWNKPANWDNGVPEGAPAFVAGGALVATSADAPEFARLNLQNGSMLTIGHAMLIGRVDDNHPTLVGNGTSGHLSITNGGSLTLLGNGTADLFNLHGIVGQSTVTVDGGSLSALDPTSGFRLGGPAGGPGAVFTLDSGAVDIAGTVRLGTNGIHNKAVMNLNGETFTYGASFVLDGNSGTGPAGGANLNINGATVLGTGTNRFFNLAAGTFSGDYGQVTLASGSLELGLNTSMNVGVAGSNIAPPSAGRFIITGGDFHAPGEDTLVQINSANFPSGVATANHGSLNQSGGTALIEGELRIGRGLPISSTSGSGSYVHLGGDMTVSNGSGTGLLRVAISSELAISGGSITADLFEFDFEVNAPTGPGRLRGNGGTLIGPIDMAGRLSPGFESGLPPPDGFIPGTLNIHGDLTLASTAETFFDFKNPTLAPGTFDSILNDGTNMVSFDGALTLRFFGGEYLTGTVSIFEYFAGYSGDFSSVTITGLTNGETATFDPSDGTVTIDVPGGLLGDLNGDGVVNLLDVTPFVEVLTSGIFIPEADINQDGVVNLLDVGPFVALLTG